MDGMLANTWVVIRKISFIQNDGLGKKSDRFKHFSKGIVYPSSNPPQAFQNLHERIRLCRIIRPIVVKLRDHGGILGAADHKAVEFRSPGLGLVDLCLELC